MARALGPDLHAHCGESLGKTAFSSCFQEWRGSVPYISIATRTIFPLAQTKIPYVSNTIVGTRAFFEQQPELAENTMKGLVESLAYILAPQNKPAVVNTIMKRLKITDPAVAEQGYHDLVQITESKPYVSLEGMRNIQRLMKIQNPPIGSVKLEELIDNRPLRKLEESGFLQKTYATYGLSK